MILPAVKILLGRFVLTGWTSFEIRGFCEVQKRASRPWLEAVPQQVESLKPGSGN